MTQLANQYPPITPEVIAKWEAALDEGYAYQHIAEMYGHSKGTIMKYLPGRGWTPEQIRAHGVLVRNGNRALAKVV